MATPACSTPAKADAVVLPTSKSMTARAFIISALAGGDIEIRGAAECQDATVLTAAVRKGSRHLGASGTAMRLYTACAAATPDWEGTLTGVPRLLERPIGPLVDALRQAGADIEYAGKEGFPPLKIRGRHLEGGDLEIDASMSSQYVSALLLVGPAMRKGLRLKLKGRKVSRGYIDMTVEMMRRAGIEVEDSGDELIVKPGRYRREPLEIEPDWSAAAFFFEIAALVAPGKRVEIEALTSAVESVQGDALAEELFGRLGVRLEGNRLVQTGAQVPEEMVIDMAGVPDMVPALSVALCLRGVKFQMLGVEHLRIKESDRIEAMTRNLRKLGYVTEYNEGAWGWSGARCEPETDPLIETFDDHRIAMAFAPVRLRQPGLRIERPEVVEKSFPDFWEQFSRALRQLKIN